MKSTELNQPSNDSPRPFYGYIIAVAGFIIMATMFSSRYAFGVFFKPVLAEFGWSRATLSGALSLSMFIEGLLGIVMGGMNDKFGPRVVLTICGVFIGIGGILMSRVEAIWQLYLFSGIVIGIGMSGAWIPITSTIARWFFKRRGLMSGFVLTGTGLAALVTPPFADWLIAAYGWRNAFSIMGIGALVIVVLTAQVFKRDPSQMGLVPHGVTMEGDSVSDLIIKGFTLKEAFSTSQFWIVILMLFSFGYCMFTVVVHLVPYATDLNISASNAAKILGSMGGTAIIGRLLLGMLSDRIGSRGIFIIGFIWMPISFLWLVSAKEAWGLYLFTVTFGIAQGGMGAAESPLVAEIFGLKSHGFIYGVVGFGFTIGAAIGPWLAGYLFDVMVSYKMAFAMCAAFGLTGLICTVFIKPIRDV
jgi:MFS family permease